jgi:Opioid growth factor receptor (OGFr) conserved region
MSIMGVSNYQFVSPVLQAGCPDIYKAVYDLASKVMRWVSECFEKAASAIFEAVGISGSRVSVGGPLNLVAFYRGLEPNNNGVALNEILNWDDGHLESAHNYIQWLFPLTTPSGPNPTAAILDNATIQVFRGDAALQSQVLRSFRRMLTFYGLQMDETTKVITRAPNFNVRAAAWLTPNNHNFLRMTRMIRSMRDLGLADYAKAFFTILQDIRRNEGQGIISVVTFIHWQGACP